MKKILKSTDKICLFCGKKMVTQWEEYSPFYECDCENAKKKKEIEEQIKDLEKKIPEHKFIIRSEPILRKSKQNN